MSRLACGAFLLIAAAISLHAQNSKPRDILLNFNPGNVFLAKSVRASILKHDLQKRAVIYRVNEKLAEDDAARRSVTDRLAPYSNIRDIDYEELDTAQYEICCDMFGLLPKPKQEMLVLYFNGNAAQFPADSEGVDLVREFRKLGWVPLDVRLDEFTKINPYNQEAIAIRFSDAASNVIDVAQASIWATLPAAMRALAPKQDRDQEADAEAVSLFIDALKSVNGLKSLDWMANESVLTPLALFGHCANSPILMGNKNLQKEAAVLLESLGRELLHYPYTHLLDRYWSNISAIVKGTDPAELLRQIKFYPISPSGYGMHDIVSHLAEGLYFTSPLWTEDMKPILDDAFKFLDYGAQWMLEQDPRLDGIFGDAFAQLTINKAQKLMVLRQYSDLEKHLENTWQAVGPKWPAVVSAMKNPMVRRPGAYYADLPDATRKRVGAILDQLPRPMAAKTPAAAAGDDPGLDGGISEERKNLNALELFIKLNPDAYYAMDMYCRDAAKFLPDEDIEKNIYNYAKITHTPPSLAAYSKMDDKESWTRLASGVISEGLLGLSDAPIGLERNPWLNLSRWEDLDLDKNAIDWHAFMKGNAFWYHPMYYVAESVMPEVVFVKYLSQAERATDWASVLSACEARYKLDKKNCQNEPVLMAWKKAEEKLTTQGRQPLGR